MSGNNTIALAFREGELASCTLAVQGQSTRLRLSSSVVNEIRPALSQRKDRGRSCTIRRLRGTRSRISMRHRIYYAQRRILRDTSAIVRRLGSAQDSGRVDEVPLFEQAFLMRRERLIIAAPAPLSTNGSHIYDDAKTGKYLAAARLKDNARVRQVRSLTSANFAAPVRPIFCGSTGRRGSLLCKPTGREVQWNPQESLQFPVSVCRIPHFSGRVD